MEGLLKEYIIPVHLNHAEMIDCYLPNKKVNHVQGQNPTQVRGKINIKSK